MPNKILYFFSNMMLLEDYGFTLKFNADRKLME